MDPNTQDRVPTLKAVCTRKDLSEGVQLVAHAVSNRNPLPILTHVLIQAEDNGLHLSASDLELSISLVIPAQVEEQGALTAPAKMLSELLSSLPDGTVSVSADRSNSARIHCPGSDYRILGLPPEEYPTLPDVEDDNTFKIPQAVLREAIRQTAFAVSADEARAILTGVLMHLDGSSVAFVATDTTRLALRETTVTDARGEAKAIVPARAMNELLRALTDGEGDVLVQLGANQARFVTPSGIVLVTRLIDGQFPNYRRVIPTTWTRRLTLETASCQSAVRRAYIVARNASGRIALRTLDDKLVITAESSMDGSALEEIGMLREGDDIEVGYNAKFLLDTLNAIDTPGFMLEMTEPLKPGIVRPKPEEGRESAAEYLCVLMPMQLS